MVNKKFTEYSIFILFKTEIIILGDIYEKREGIKRSVYKKITTANC